MNQRPAYDQELLLRTLRISIEHYRDMLFQQGMRYLDLYMHDDEAGRVFLAELPEYWTWWTHQADLRNARFMRQHDLEHTAQWVGKWERATLNGYFDVLHDAQLLQEVRPARYVMRRALALQRNRSTTDR